MSSPKSSSPNPKKLKALPQNFYRRDSETVAKDLLGKGLLVNHDGELLLAEITETEAYSQDDPAAHSFRGKTKRTWPMFEVGGHSYVYVLHRHHCINVVTGEAGYGDAVLLRAAQPLCGIETMRELRGAATLKAEPPDHQLLAGPGRLCKGMGITLAHNGLTFWGQNLRVVDLGKTVRPSEVCTTTRIGITKAADLLRRYCVKDAPSLSRKVRDLGV